MVRYIRDHEKHFPGLVKTTEVGKTKEGKIIYSVEITSDIEGKERIKPNIGFIGTLHGYDVVSQEILLMFVHHLTKKFHEKDQRIVDLLKSVRIHVIVNANVDGLSQAQKGDCNGTMYSGQDFYNEFGIRKDDIAGDMEVIESKVFLCLKKFLMPVNRN